MNQKQWPWIYRKLKNFIASHAGTVTDQTASDAMKLYEDILTVTEKSREASPDLDKQIETIFGYLFCIIQSLELTEGAL